MINNFPVLLVSFILLIGCQKAPQPNSEMNGKIQLPDVNVASELPQFRKEANEIEVADSFNNIDPSMIIGAIVRRNNGTIHPFDGFLNDEKSIVTKSVSEIAFKNFIENSVVANSNWLDFLKGQVNNSVRAEVAVTEIRNVFAAKSAFDKVSLNKLAEKIPENVAEEFGIIVGFRDFLVSATLFKDQGAEGSVNGYGAQIGGKWYGKYENSSAVHRIVAIWSPLPLMFHLAKDDTEPGSVLISDATKGAIASNKITIAPIASSRLSAHVERKEIKAWAMGPIDNSIIWQ